MPTIQRLQRGVCFIETDDSPASLILLDAKKGRYDFPELKQVAMEQFKYWDPDTVIVEAKASGQPLTDELKEDGYTCRQFYTPSKGNDKHTQSKFGCTFI